MKYIWVVSYPKSGNTWMRLLLRNYFEESTGFRPFETSDVGSYFYQTVSPVPLDLLDMPGLMQLRPAAMMHMNAVYENKATGTEVDTVIVKSHMAAGDVFGIPFFCPLWAEKVIYIYRDPRDIVASFADHLGNSQEEIVELMGKTEDGVIGQAPQIPSILGSWSTHVRSWVLSRREHRPETTVTSYERMHENPRRELIHALEFCEIEPEMFAVERAVEACHFVNLQAWEEEEGFPERSDKSEKFFRKGVIGGYKKEVSRKLIRKIEKDHKSVMETLKYL